MISQDEAIELFKFAPKESFELLLRNIEIRKILEDLWERHQVGDISYDEKLEKIYDEFSKFFYRPIEISMFGIRQLSYLFPFIDFMKIIESQTEFLDTYCEFLSSVFSHLRLLSEIYFTYTTSEPVKSVLDRFLDQYADLIRSCGSEFTKIDLIHEYPLILPKKVFEYLDNAINSWKNFSEYFRSYRELRKQAFVTAAERFIEIANSKKFSDFSDFLNAFLNEEVKEFDSLLSSDRYIETQKKMIESLMDYVYYFRRFYEGIAESNPLNPFATVSQMDEAFKRIFDLKRRIKELEKRLESIERGVQK